jgi:hypothetical protein
MSKWLKAAAGVVFLGLFAWLFWMAGGEPSLGWHRASPTPTAAAVKRGNFGKYLYGLTDASGNKKVAQFDPSLPTDGTGRFWHRDP